MQIDFLHGILRTAEKSGSAAGLIQLLVHTQRQRDALEPAVLRAAKRIEASGVLDQILSAAKKLIARGGADADEYSPAACRQAGQFVLERLDQLLARQDCLDDPQDCEGHHALRIAVKRLRDTLEVAKPLCPGQLEEFVDAAKRLQTLLGDVHDCDVWQEQLAEFARRESARLTQRFGGQGRFTRLVPGIELVKCERAEHRAAVFQELVRYWREARPAENMAAAQGTRGVPRRADRRRAAGQRDRAAPPQGGVANDRAGGNRCPRLAFCAYRRLPRPGRRTWSQPLPGRPLLARPRRPHPTAASG